MKANINEISLTEYPSIPAYWPERPNQIHYNKLPMQAHTGDGWRDIIDPTYDSETQKLGSAIKDGNDGVTRQIIDIPIEEQEQKKIDRVKLERQQKIEVESKKLIEKQVMESFQAQTGDSKAGENKSIYPLWEEIENGFEFPNPYKVQAYDGRELHLFKIIQSHTKQSNWHPNRNPALWSKIEVGSGGIEIWTQPTGGDGKYPYIDPLTGNPYQVTDNDQTWENSHQGSLNVWKPGVFGWVKV